MEVKDRRQSEIQSLVTSAVVIDFIDEIQRVEVISNIGEVFQIEFLGQKICVTSASYYWSSHCFVKWAISHYPRFSVVHANNMACNLPLT